MKALFLLPALFVSLFALAQPKINQVNEEGYKIGKWVTYHTNGKVLEENYYKPSFKSGDRASTFVLGLPPKDTIIYYDGLLRTDQYLYNDDWELIRVKRKEGTKVSFLYGPNKALGLSYDHFSSFGRVGTLHTMPIDLVNYSDQPLTLSLTFSAANLKSKEKQLIIPPNDMIVFEVALTLEPGEQNYQISISNETIQADIQVQAFGHHLASWEVKEGVMLSLQKEFVYYRSGNEALLQVYNNKREKVLKTISLSKERTHVNLGNLKPGIYWISKTDYSAGKQIFSQVLVK